MSGVRCRVKNGVSGVRCRVSGLSAASITKCHFRELPHAVTKYGLVVVLVLVLDKILIHKDEHENEDEYEKYQIRSPESALI